MKWSEERKQKRSETMSGKNHPMYGYKWSEEQKDYFRKINIGKNNPNFNKKGKDNPLSKPVIQLDKDFNLIKKYDSTKEVKKYGYSDGSVCSCCLRYKIYRKDRNNKLYIRYKYKDCYWFYEEEYLNKTKEELQEIINKCIELIKN